MEEAMELEEPQQEAKKASKQKPNQDAGRNPEQEADQDSDQELQEDPDQDREQESEQKSEQSSEQELQPKSMKVNDTGIICLPGERICLADNYKVAYIGTYERLGYIYATLAGTVVITAHGKTEYVEVKTVGKQSMIPYVNDIVTAHVLQVNQRYAKCSIICVGDYMLDRKYKAILRKEDVRAIEKDRVDMYKCFRPNDIILARVLPQSESTNYQISTAENELGVVTAYASENDPSGSPMVPISWTEMQCPDTLVKEPRKVARSQPVSKMQGFSNESKHKNTN